MKNSLHEIIKERLENRLEWRNYLGYVLTHRDLQRLAKEQFYKDKPLLNFFLKIYFLPYNTLKYFRYISERHEFDKICKEVEFLKNANGNEGEEYLNKKNEDCK